MVLAMDESRAASALLVVAVMAVSVASLLSSLFIAAMLLMMMDAGLRLRAIEQHTRRRV